jgi:hypothetical protein
LPHASHRCDAGIGVEPDLGFGIVDGMRWLFRTAVVLATLLAVYAAWPWWDLHRLARALEQRDAATLIHGIAFDDLRRSLSLQIARTYLNVSGQDRRLGPLATDLAVNLGASVAEPLVARFVTPQGIAELLTAGWPTALAEEAPPSTAAIGPDTCDSAWRLFASAKYRGRRFVIDLPPGRPSSERFRLGLRLTGGRWKLVSIDLPSETSLRFAHVLVRMRTR